MHVEARAVPGGIRADAVRREQPTLPVIILTANGTIPDAVAATERGVFGFLTKPFDGRALVTVDSVGAGVGETVFFVRGREASYAFHPAEVPTDAGIVGILDHWTLGER